MDEEISMFLHRILKIARLLTVVLIGLSSQASFAVVVPAYSSLAGSPRTLYLNFGGLDYSGTWAGKTPGIVPAYDVDGNATAFSDVELANIQQIWGRVAEAYSPFNVNVTTVSPGAIPVENAWSQIVIGPQKASGSDWYGSCGGVAYVNGFKSGGLEYGTGWAFTDHLDNGTPKYTAISATHEAGHQFGLYHQKLYAADGKLVSDYRPSMDGDRTAPIMGVAYSSIRDLWSDGTSGSATSYQSDRDILTTTLGYRPDGDNDDMTHAIPLIATPDATISASGIIKEPTENDFFKFTTDSGLVSLNVCHNAYGGMLDSKLLLYDDEGFLLQSIDPVLTSTRPNYGLDASFNGYLEAGFYYLGITSHGSYGDVGQYTVTGTIVVPEPGTLILLELGSMCLLAFAWRSRMCATFRRYHQLPFTN
jgi:hypothetical protein